MPARPHSAFRSLPTALAALAALAGGGSARAQSEPNPYYIGVTQTVTHDSNVYRLQGGGPSDTYYSTGLVGGFDQSIGRQRVFGNGNVRYNSYGDQSDLSNLSYGLNAGWDWSTINRLSGNVNVAATQNLASFYGNQTQATTDRQLVRTAQAGTSVRYGGIGRFSVGGDYSHSIVRYSGGQNASFNNSSGDSLGGGVYYNVNPDTVAGIGYRVTRTVQPNGLFVSQNQYDELTSRGRNIDFTLSYRYSAQTNFSGRVSLTRQSNSGASGQDFSGVTGGVNANYQPTGKLGLSIGYARDAGTNGNFFNVPLTAGTTTPTTTSSTTGLYTNSQTTDSLTLGANYAATAKVGINAGYVYRKAKIAGNTTVGGVSTNSSYNDDFKVASLGASYAALRWLSFNCNLSHENRSTSAANGYGYSANVVSCTAQATLR